MLVGRQEADQGRGIERLKRNACWMRALGIDFATICGEGSRADVWSRLFHGASFAVAAAPRCSCKNDHLLDR